MFPVFHQNVVYLFLLLMWGHWIADFPLQGPYLSEAKNPDGDLGKHGVWKHAMSAHCGIQAGFVLLFTGSIHCALLEFVVHFWIDYCKCKKWISYNTDQTMHVIAKIIYVIAVFSS